MPSAPLKVTILGSGTSMGVPTLGCHCRVCSSNDPRDKRLRPSLLLSRNGQNVVIDTTPDFRQQALRSGIDRLDAILLTHGHADHILGFDDKPTLSTVPSVTLNTMQGPLEALGISIVPVPLLHGAMDVLGFRFGR